MAMLVGLMPISGGVDWQITRADNPGVLTMVFSRQVATDAAVPDVSPPRSDRKPGLLTSTPLETTCIQRLPHTSPRGPGASSAQRPQRWGHRCASTSRQRCSGRACYELGQKPHRNADSTFDLVPSRSPFSAYLSCLLSSS